MIYDEVKNYLENEPRGRERKNKDRAIVNILLKRYPRLQDIQKEILVDFVKDYNSHDRAWRKVLEENPELRGADYDDKTILEQKKILELGYEVGNYKQLSYIK